MTRLRLELLERRDLLTGWPIRAMGQDAQVAVIEDGSSETNLLSSVDLNKTQEVGSAFYHYSAQAAVMVMAREVQGQPTIEVSTQTIVQTAPEVELGLHEERLLAGVEHVAARFSVVVTGSGHVALSIFGVARVDQTTTLQCSHCGETTTHTAEARLTMHEIAVTGTDYSIEVSGIVDQWLFDDFADFGSLGMSGMAERGDANLNISVHAEEQSYLGNTLAVLSGTTQSTIDAVPLSWVAQASESFNFIDQDSVTIARDVRRAHYDGTLFDDNLSTTFMQVTTGANVNRDSTFEGEIDTLMATRVGLEGHFLTELLSSDDFENELATGVVWADGEEETSLLVMEVVDDLVASLF